MKIVTSASDLTSERLAGVYAAWIRVANARMAPRREEITPALLKTALPWIWMIDSVDGGKDYRFRIAGDRIVQFMGRRYAGLLLSEFEGEPFFERMRAILQECVRLKHPLVAGPMRSNLKGREYLEMEVVVLPLSEDGEQVTTLFGAMEVNPVAPRLPEGQP